MGKKITKATLWKWFAMSGKDFEYHGREEENVSPFYLKDKFGNVHYTVKLRDLPGDNFSIEVYSGDSVILYEYISPASDYNKNALKLAVCLSLKIKEYYGIKSH